MGEVPKYVDKIVEVPIIQKVQRFVEVPRIEKVIKYVDKPTDSIQEVIVEVPKVEFVDKIVEVPRIRKVTKYIEVPEIRYIDKVVDLPKITTIEKIIEITKDHHERIQEATTSVLVDAGTEVVNAPIERVGLKIEGDPLDPLTSSIMHQWDESKEIPAMYATVALPPLPMDHHENLPQAALTGNLNMTREPKPLNVNMPTLPKLENPFKNVQLGASSLGQSNNGFGQLGQGFGVGVGLGNGVGGGSKPAGNLGGTANDSPTA